MRRRESFLIKRISILTFLLVVATSLQSQVSSFRNFGLDKNAFPSRIECVNQASTGELYIGTLAGLVIYNGYSFDQIFEKDGLAENAISTISVRDSSVWIGHWAGSLTILNPYTREIVVADIKAEVGYNSISNITPISDTSAYVITNDGQALHYSPKGLEQVLLPELNPEHQVKQLIKDTSGFFVLTNNAVYKWQGDGSNNGMKIIFQTTQEITAAHYLQVGQWVFGVGNKVIDFNSKTNNTKVVAELNEFSSVVSIIQDFEEFIWIATNNSGILKYHSITGSKESITRNNGLSYNQIRYLFHDREGQVWIATSAGLDQYLGRSFLLFDRKVGLIDNLIWDFTRFHEQILLATPSGLHLMDINKEGQFVLLKTFDLNGEEPRKIVTGQGSQQIFVITDKHNLWTGNFGRDLVQIEDVAGKTLCLEDVNGEIWVGTNKGIIKLQNNKAVEQYSVEIGLGGTKVNGIYYSKTKNETWITALGGSCALYRDGRFKLYGAQEGMVSNIIQDAAFDSDGNPWFATYDEGVIYLKDDKFHRLSDYVELSSNTTFAIAIDKDDAVWIGHNWGLDMYKIPYGTITNFTSANGFMGIEVNPGAISIDKNNNLWMGTLLGLLRFTPANLRTNLSEPISRITRARIGEFQLTYKNSYRLDFSESNLELNFAGVSLVNPEDNRFHYRLIGVNDKWRVKDDLSPIEYASLPPGDFRFELKTCNGQDVCSSNPAVFEFSILPPFYRTWWFYTVLFVFVVIAIFLMDRFRVLSLVDEKNVISEKLLESEQNLIEVNHEIESLRKRGILNAEMMMQMSPKALKSDDRFLVHRLKIENVSSDQILDFSVGEWRLRGLVDIGVSGEIAMYLMEVIKGTLLQACLNTKPRDVDDVFRMLATAIQQTLEKLEKHKGCNWVLWIETADGLRLNIFRNVVYQLLEAEVVEFYGGNEISEGTFFDVNLTGRLFFASDGAKDQLSADGMQAFSNRKLLNGIHNRFRMSSEDLLSSLIKDIEDWRGSMELTDDITLVTFEL